MACSHRGAVSWARFAQMVAEAAGLDVGLIHAVPGAALGQIAVRPRYSALRSERGLMLAPIEDAIQHYLADAKHELSMHAVNDMSFDTASTEIAGRAA